MRDQVMSQSTQISTLDKLLNLLEVQQQTSLSRTTIYRLIESGEFPRPVKIGRTSRWPTSEISAFIDDRKADRTASQGSEVSQ